jgi:peptidyl-prolyl cis-trans isomerase B (cyclophilin B)
MSKVRFTTNHGAFVVELNAEKAPKTVANFIDYVQSGHYDGTIFHRVIKGFMIQGGGHLVGMKEKSKSLNASITNEADNGLKNDKYTIAMARTSDPHSATAQFFINGTDNDFLNFSSPTASGWGYAVFGAVIEGFDVVDAIEGVKTSRSGFHQDVPAEDVIIEKAELI